MSVPPVAISLLRSLKNLANIKIWKLKFAKMWKMKTKIIPVIVGSLGIIKKRTQKNVNGIPGNLSLAEIQKIVVDSAAHILRRTLSL